MNFCQLMVGSDAPGDAPEQATRRTEFLTAGSSYMRNLRGKYANCKNLQFDVREAQLE
jgi:hypothetical protein